MTNKSENDFILYQGLEQFAQLLKKTTILRYILARVSDSQGLHTVLIIHM